MLFQKRVVRTKLDNYIFIDLHKFCDCRCDLRATMSVIIVACRYRWHGWQSFYYTFLSIVIRIGIVFFLDTTSSPNRKKKMCSYWNINECYE